MHDNADAVGFLANSCIFWDWRRRNWDRNVWKPGEEDGGAAVEDSAETEEVHRVMGGAGDGWGCSAETGGTEAEREVGAVREGGVVPIKGAVFATQERIRMLVFGSCCR